MLYCFIDKLPISHESIRPLDNYARRDEWERVKAYDQQREKRYRRLKNRTNRKSKRKKEQKQTSN